MSVDPRLILWILEAEATPAAAVFRASCPKKPPEANFGFGKWCRLSRAGRALVPGKEMTIDRLLKDSKLTPKEIERLNRAYAFALRSLHLVDRDDPLTEMIAKKVVEIGADVELDPSEIAEIARKQLGV